MDDRKLYIGNPAYGVIIRFLQGQCADWDGRWLSDIRRWSLEELETDHYYIQWLFPLATESEAVFAPVLREFEVLELQTDITLQQEMIVSLRQMLGFYGFALHAEAERIVVSPAEGYHERLKWWLTPDNHNYRRISRILGSLKLAKLNVYAEAFLQALERLAQTAEGRNKIDGTALWYWRNRALGKR